MEDNYKKKFIDIEKLESQIIVSYVKRKEY